MIDKTAVVHPSAQIAEDAYIGPNVVIGEGVKIGSGTRVIANAYIEFAEIGKNCTISPFATIGSEPQDLGYKGQKTKVVVGKNCIIKEFVSITTLLFSGLGNLIFTGNINGGIQIEEQKIEGELAKAMNTMYEENPQMFHSLIQFAYGYLIEMITGEKKFYLYEGTREEFCKVTIPYRSTLVFYFVKISYLNLRVLSEI